MKTGNDTLKTDNRTITTLIILIAIMIAPLVPSLFKGAWNYHVNCITEDEIADYVIDNLDDKTAVFLGQSVTDDQIVSWWRTGNDHFGTTYVFEFQKSKDKYSLLRKTAPGFEKYGLYSLWSSNHGFYLITDPNCVKATYTLNETLHTVPVDTVPYVFSVPGFPVDVILHSADTAE
ncbi:MAG: hypothetical protein IKV66_07025 [Clostridia bacterium]|nr:hypothetical protein [Clostridia bacterium]